MWQADVDPSLRFRIVGVVVLACEPDPAVLQDRVDRLTRAVPRLRHRVVRSPFPGLRPHWELDPHFDLGFHFRRVLLTPGSEESDVLAMASTACQDDFPAGRSPWRMMLVTGLSGGRAALVVTLHHVITDGIGAVQMAQMMFDLDAAGHTPEELGPLPAVAVPRERRTPERVIAGVTQERDQIDMLGGLVRSTANGVRDPRRAGRTLAQAASAARQVADPTTSLGSPLPRSGTPASHYLTVRVPVDQLKAAGRAAGGKLNDAYLAGLVGGFRRYHDKHGFAITTVRCSMPVNTRAADSSEAAGNDVLIKMCTLPTDIEDPAARIASIAELSRREQTEGSHVFSQALAGVLARLPGPAARAALGTLADSLDFNTTNVPGVPVPLFLAGAPVAAMYPFVSRSRSPLMAALISYNGTAHIALSIDPVAVPDTHVLATCIQEEFDALLARTDLHA